MYNSSMSNLMKISSTFSTCYMQTDEQIWVRLINSFLHNFVANPQSLHPKGLVLGTPRAAVLDFCSLLTFL
jgi:hypothetical protein